MSIQLSRRDFMKCSAVAVLAAASGTLLTGCSGGAGGSIPADQPISQRMALQSKWSVGMIPNIPFSANRTTIILLLLVIISFLI